MESCLTAWSLQAGKLRKHATWRDPRAATASDSAKRVRRSSPTNWLSCECVRLQKMTCRRAGACAASFAASSGASLSLLLLSPAADLAMAHHIQHRCSRQVPGLNASIPRRYVRCWTPCSSVLQAWRHASVLLTLTLSSHSRASRACVSVSLRKAGRLSSLKACKCTQ